MGLFSNIISAITGKPKEGKYAEVLNGFAPIFSQFGTNIYASDVVQQAITCIVNEMKKLRPEHIREINNDVTTVDSDLRVVLNNPNPLMTTSEFLEKITWLLFLNYNVFIVPTYYEWIDKDGTLKRKIDGLYPIQPSQVDFIEDMSGSLFVKFRFANGKEFEPIKYTDIVHVKYRYSVNQYMGGNEMGQPDNEALLKTLTINDLLLQGVSKAMKSSSAINGVVKYNSLLDGEKTEAALKELEGKLKNSESGFLPLDLKAEYIPIKKEIALVDANTLKFIDEKILRHFGVSIPILTGDYTKAQYEAFYQKTLEPIIIAFSQAFTKALFTDREKGYKNKVMFYPKDLIFMSVGETLQMVTLLSNTGALFENEKRVAFGLKPLKELEGKRYMSLNWIDANKANLYQTGQESEGANNEQ